MTVDGLAPVAARVSDLGRCAEADLHRAARPVRRRPTRRRLRRAIPARGGRDGLGGTLASVAARMGHRLGPPERAALARGARRGSDARRCPPTRRLLPVPGQRAELGSAKRSIHRRLRLRQRSSLRRPRRADGAPDTRRDLSHSTGERPVAASSATLRGTTSRSRSSARRRS